MHKYENGQRWLWIFTYILLPLNLLGIVIQFFVLANNEALSALSVLLILLGLAQFSALLYGINKARPWAWYLLIISLALQCLSTPIKHHSKKAFTYEITSSVARYKESIGERSYTPTKPSLFDADNIIIFILLLLIWTTPNAIYFYKRASFFGLQPDPFGFGTQSSSPGAGNLPALSSDEQNALYAQALEEIESGNQDKGIWAKSFAEANGDTNQAKAKYIATRVEQFTLTQQKEALQKQLLDLADQIPKAQQRLEKAKIDMKLMETKFATNTASSADYNNALLEVSEAKSALRKTKAKLDRIQKLTGQFNQVK